MNWNKSVMRGCLAALISLGTACSNESPPSTTTSNDTVNSVRARAESDWRKFMLKPGIGTLIHTQTVTSPAGGQLAATQVITLWHQGSGLRVEARDEAGAGSALQVSDGHTVRTNIGGSTTDVYVDRLKSGNQHKLADSIAGNRALALFDRGVPTLSQDAANFYLSVGPVDNPVLGKIYITATVDKGTSALTAIESHMETPSGAVVDDSYSLIKQPASSLPAGLFALPGVQGKIRDLTATIDSMLDGA